jgi:hypothetical protein
MKATELRLGNLLWCKRNNAIMKVEELGLDEHIISFVLDRSKFPLPSGWQVGPIPLTEGWLHKFGFRGKDYHVGFIGIEHKAGGMTTDFVLTYPGVIGAYQKYFSFEFKTGRLPKFIELQYVHQLQNLFFAMTDQELIIQDEQPSPHCCCDTDLVCPLHIKE